MSDRLLSQNQLMMALNGSPEYLGTITSTSSSSTNNFAIPAGSILMLQPDADVTLIGVSGASGTVSATNGVDVGAGQRFYMTLRRDQTHVACIGAASVKVFRLS